MKTLNMLTVFTRPPVFAAAIAIVAVFAFVSSATAAEKKFDALGGVTVEAMTPAAMDGVQGMGAGFILVGWLNGTYSDIVVGKLIGGRPVGKFIKGPMHITVDLFAKIVTVTKF